VEWWMHIPIAPNEWNSTHLSNDSGASSVGLISNV
jgi:hypothetical protein